MIRELLLNYVKIDNVFVDGSLSYNRPLKNIESIAVPGRNGNLIIDYGTWQNVVITYPCYMIADDVDDFDTKYSALVNRLAGISGYVRLTDRIDGVDPSHYRLARPIVPQTVTLKDVDRKAFFNLSFDCKPQRFLRSGDSIEGINAGGSLTLTNPTQNTARPKITVNLGSAESGTVQIGDTTITVSGIPTMESHVVEIDCETMQCYTKIPNQGWINRNKNVSFSSNDFPTLPPGDTTITVPAAASGGAARVIITPHWWEL
jgi:phage-related protein